MNRIHAVLGIVFLVASLAYPQTSLTDTWTGMVSSSWHDGGNWTLGAPPSSNDTAVIPAPLPGRFEPHITISDVVSGALTIDPAATVTLDGRVLTVRGALTNSGTIARTAAPGAFLRLDGGAVVTTFGSCAVDVESVAGFGAPGIQVIVPGNFRVVGTFQVGNFGSLSITGNLTVDGGELIVPNSLTVVDVGGDVTLLNMPQTTFATFFCGGDWFADATYNTPSGLVTFDGSSPQTIAGAGLFPSIAVSSGSNVAATVPIFCPGELFVHGTISIAATLSVGSLTTGTTLITGTVLGPGTLVLTGLNTFTTGPNASIENLEIAFSPIVPFTLTGDFSVPGAFTLTGGILNLNGKKLTVGGAALFRGGQLSGGGNAASVLDLNGPTTFSGTVPAAAGVPQSIRAAADWSADASFNPTSGTVLFDGIGPQSIGGSAPRFFHASIAATSISNVLSVVQVSGNLTVAGQLSLAADVQLLGAPIVSGSVGGAATLKLVGSQNVPLSYSGQIAKLEIAKSANNVEVALTSSPAPLASFRLSQGRFTTAGSTLTVNGPSIFIGGMLSNSAIGGVLDLNGDVTFAGSILDGPFIPPIRCAGNWTSDASFNPIAASVTFDGSAPQTIGGAAVGFFNLIVASGASATTLVPLVVNADLSINGELSSAFSIEVFGNVTAQTGTLSGSGILRMKGGNTALVIGQIPHLEATKTGTAAVGLLGALTVSDFKLLSGFLRTNGHSLTVNGPADFLGGTISNSGIGGMLDLNGNVVFSNTTSDNGFIPQINVAGHWTADAVLAPTSGTIRFDGSSPQSIGGAAANFRNLDIATGALVTAQVSLAIGGDLLVLGSLSSTFPIEVLGNVTAQTGTLSGSGVLRMKGTSGAVVIGQVPHLEAAKTGSVAVGLSGSVTVADFKLKSGFLRTNGHTLTVNGPAEFLGGTISNSAIGGVLDLNGNVVFSNTTSDGGFIPQINVAGHWTADATLLPIAGTIKFDGSSPQSIGGTAANFRNLEIAAGASVTAQLPLMIGGDLFVLGSLSSAFSIEVLGNVTVQTGTIAGSGVLRMKGAVGSFIIGQVPHLEAAKTGTVAVGLSGAVTVSDFKLVSGFLRTNGHTLTVNGPADFLGGTISNSAIGGALDLNGDVVFSNTTSDGGFIPTINVAGNYAADAVFSPIGNTIRFDGVAPQTIGGTTANFWMLEIASGASVTALLPLRIGANLETNGTLATASTIDVFGNVANQSGVLSGPGVVRMKGNSSAGVIGTVPHLEAAKSGSASVGLFGPVAAQDFKLLSGFLRTNGHTLTVSGPADFVGGTISNAGIGGALDVNGNATFTNTTFENPFAPTIRVAGNFSADAAFAPTNGVVELDGVGATTLTPIVPGGVLTFAQLTIKNGARSAASDQSWRAQSVIIESNGSFSTSNRRVAVHRPTGPTPISVNGLLAVPAGGELALGPSSTLSVAGSGTLSLIGVVGNPARLLGEAGGGYSAIVSGTLAARYFSIERPNAAGFTITNAATIAAAPNDLRDGAFDFPAGSSGAALLDLRRPQASTFEGIAFHNTGGTVGTFNVRVTGGAPIVFSNWSGAFGGPTFESDPAGLVAWTNSANAVVTNFAANVAAYAATLSWTSTFESAISGYLLERRPTNGGPFLAVAQTGPQGPSAYQTVDTTVRSSTPYEWRLSFLSASGSPTVVATTTATTPPGFPFPTNVLTVGPGGFATIQDAINAATSPNSVIAVRPGTYPSFTIGATPPGGLRVVGDGSGIVAIDTTLGPVVIQGTGAADVVELADLTVGSASSPNGGIAVVSCSGPVILDRLVVSGGQGSTPIAVALAASTSVAIQRSQMTGAPGLHLTQGSIAAASRGSVSSTSIATGSRLTTTEISGSVPTLDAGSTLTAYPGIMPNVDLPRFPRLNDVLVVDYSATPFSAWYLILAQTNVFVESPGAQVQMPLLLDPAAAALIHTGFTDVMGRDALPLSVPPVGVLVGFVFEFQALSIDSVSGALRLSNVAGSTILP